MFQTILLLLIRLLDKHSKILELRWSFDNRIELLLWCFYINQRIWKPFYLLKSMLEYSFAFDSLSKNVLPWNCQNNNNNNKMDENTLKFIESSVIFTHHPLVTYWIYIYFRFVAEFADLKSSMTCIWWRPCMMSVSPYGCYDAFIWQTLHHLVASVSFWAKRYLEHCQPNIFSRMCWNGIKQMWRIIVIDKG